MPIDTRTIAFNQSELKEALFNYCSATGHGLCDPGLTHLKVSDEKGVVAIVEGHAPGVATVFAQNEIAAALILYCRDQKIPLPRAAKKSLKMLGGSIALCTVWENRNNRHIRASDLGGAAEKASAAPSF